jgi:methylmalonyl-CoA mutase cobalamin-binding domain/chain
VGDQLFEELRVAISERDGDAVAIAERIVAEDGNAQAAIEVSTEAIREIGEKFETGELYLPDLMIAGREMEQVMAILKPHVRGTDGATSGGRVLIGTVSGDIHDIGKNLVATMLTVAGFDVIDLGINVTSMDFIKATQKESPDVIALSSLMTTSLPYQEEVLAFLNELGVRDQHYVIVGGGPVTPEFAGTLGADGWAQNAAMAVTLCNTLIKSEEPPASRTVVLGDSV